MNKKLDVYLAGPRGFCAGVERAILMVQEAIKKYGAPVYVRHEIVHNQYVVNSLKAKGAIFVEEIDEIPFDSTVIYSAHGVAPEIWHSAKSRNLRIIDATCPLVIKVHNESLKYANDDYSVIVVGHQGHPEVIGTVGQSPDKSILVEDEIDASQLEIKNPDKVVALTQTTLSVDDTKEIIGALKNRFPNIVARNDICYATTNRQAAVRAIAERAGLVIVVGSANSSNSVRLQEVAASTGTVSYRVDGLSDIDPNWYKNVDIVGLSAGASVPDSLLDPIIKDLRMRGVTKVEPVIVAEETIEFRPPDNS